MNMIARIEMPSSVAGNLTPGQSAMLERLALLSRAEHAIALGGAPGSGKTSLLAALAEREGGILLRHADYLKVCRARPSSGDDDLPVLRFLQDTLATTDLLVLDDLPNFVDTFARATRMVLGSRMVFDQILRDAEALGKRVVVSGQAKTEDMSVARIYRNDTIAYLEMPRFEAEDFAAICTFYLGEAKASSIDFKQIHRFAPGLNGYDLRLGCRAAAGHDTIDTRAFMEVLSEFVIRSNTRTHEVEGISFAEMPGTKELAAKLERNIVLPLTNHELSDRLGLEAKRGVLLYGPPGTGKTSVGRALAHRMKGRFFLIDGSVNTEPVWEFLPKVEAIVKEAKDNAPCVLFIDDADVLFGIEHIAGFARYMLSLLDGLQSASASKVCVMMTAMDARKIPEALLRSGRVELWLETKLPDLETREAILKRWIGTELPDHAKVDTRRIAEMTDGFTPADLRRVNADARSFYARDLAMERQLRNATEYLVAAAQDLIQTRRQMEEVLGSGKLTLRVAR